MSYKDKQIDVQSKEINLNGDKIMLSVWMYKYSSDEKIDINQFKIK